MYLSGPHGDDDRIIGGHQSEVDSERRVAGSVLQISFLTAVLKRKSIERWRRIESTESMEQWKAAEYCDRVSQL